jgi:hypothetical protein
MKSARSTTVAQRVWSRGHVVAVLRVAVLRVAVLRYGDAVEEARCA